MLTRDMLLASASNSDGQQSRQQKL